MGIGQPDPARHDGQSCERECAACLALDKRDLIGANDKDDEAFASSTTQQTSRFETGKRGRDPSSGTPEHNKESR
jgi:hypothetical protein